MKFAIIFGLVALSCAAQASFFPIDLRPQNMFGNVKEQLFNSKKLLDNVLNGATSKLQEEVDKIKQNLENIIQTLNEKATGMNANVYKLFERFLNTLNVLTDDITNYDGKADLTTCKEMAESAQEGIKNVIRSGTKCFSDKIDRAEELVKSVLSQANAGFNALFQVKAESEECFKDVDGIIAGGKAIACMTAAATKGTWTATTQIPGILVELTKISTLVNTLVPALSVCVSKNSVFTAYEETKVVVGNVRQCVLDKIKEIDEKATKIPSLAGNDNELYNENFDNDLLGDFPEMTEVSKITAAVLRTGVDEVPKVVVETRILDTENDDADEKELVDLLGEIMN